MATAGVVGSALIAINQGERVLARQELDVVKAVLTIVVPYLVAIYGAVAAHRCQERRCNGAAKQ